MCVCVYYIIWLVLAKFVALLHPCWFFCNNVFKGDLLCKNHFYKVFEHSCVAAVCENNQPIILKVHPLIFV